MLGTRRGSQQRVGGFGGGTCKSTAPSLQSLVIVARKHVGSRLKVSSLHFGMARFYANYPQAKTSIWATPIVAALLQQQGVQRGCYRVPLLGVPSAERELTLA